MRDLAGGRQSGGHEELLARAVVRTGGLNAQDRARLREAAAHAAGNGTPLRELIDAYLGALCRTCAPSAGGGCAVSVPVPAEVLGPVRDVAVTLTEGYEAAHRAAIRREEEIRQAFLDELLHGAGDLGRMAEQAHRIGFRFAGPHR
ncbi:PucR family transcriptional regulator, partial [Streptomyces sp. TRM72054]|nr:PucR family transcriptional regulator [Streptomyces sp. TRM72054]